MKCKEVNRGAHTTTFAEDSTERRTLGRPSVHSSESIIIHKTHPYGCAHFLAGGQASTSLARAKRRVVLHFLSRDLRIVLAKSLLQLLLAALAAHVVNERNTLVAAQRVE